MRRSFWSETLRMSLNDRDRKATGLDIGNVALLFVSNGREIFDYCGLNLSLRIVEILTLKVRAITSSGSPDCLMRRASSR